MPVKTMLAAENAEAHAQFSVERYSDYVRFNAIKPALVDAYTSVLRSKAFEEITGLDATLTELRKKLPGMKFGKEDTGLLDAALEKSLEAYAEEDREEVMQGLLECFFVVTRNTTNEGVLEDFEEEAKAIKEAAPFVEKDAKLRDMVTKLAWAMSYDSIIILQTTKASGRTLKDYANLAEIVHDVQMPLTSLANAYKPEDAADQLLAWIEYGLHGEEKESFSVKSFLEDDSALERWPYKISGEDFQVSCGVRGLERALVNLLRNAAQETTPDGSKTEVELVMDKENKRLLVKDNGGGLAPQVEESIRQLFDGGIDAPINSTKSHGMGIGLISVAHRLKENNVKISFETKQGEGTTFILDFSECSEA